MPEKPLQSHIGSWPHNVKRRILLTNNEEVGELMFIFLVENKPFIHSRLKPKQNTKVSDQGIFQKRPQEVCGPFKGE